MTHEPPDRRAPQGPEPSGRCDLPGLLRALDAVEPPPLWDDILASALEPTAEVAARRNREAPRRDRQPMTLLVAAAIVVLAVAGAVLAVGRERTPEATMATLGNSSATEQEAGAPSASDPSAEGSTSGPTDGRSTATTAGGQGGENESGGGNGGTPGGGDGGSDRGGATPGSPSDKGGATVQPGQPDPARPSTSTSSPTRVPVIPPSPPPPFEEPLIWGQSWVGTVFRSTDAVVDVGLSTFPLPPVLDLNEEGIVQFTWCGGFRVQAPLYGATLRIDPVSWVEIPPAVACDDDTSGGERIMQELFRSNPTVSVDEGRITLVSGPYSAVFVPQG